MKMLAAHEISSLWETRSARRKTENADVVQNEPEDINESKEGAQRERLSLNGHFVIGARPGPARPEIPVLVKSSACVLLLPTAYRRRPEKTTSKKECFSSTLALPCFRTARNSIVVKWYRGRRPSSLKFFTSGIPGWSRFALRWDIE